MVRSKRGILGGTGVPVGAEEAPGGGTCTGPFGGAGGGKQGTIGARLSEGGGGAFLRLVAGVTGGREGRGGAL